MALLSDLYTQALGQRLGGGAGVRFARRPSATGWRDRCRSLVATTERRGAGEEEQWTGAPGRGPGRGRRGGGSRRPRTAPGMPGASGVGTSEAVPLRCPGCASRPPLGAVIPELLDGRLSAAAPDDWREPTGGTGNCPGRRGPWARRDLDVRYASDHERSAGRART